MAIADKLVLQRQHHLKWPAFDKLELVLMIVCGVLCFGFSLSVTADIVTRTIGHPWLWLQEVTSTLFIYAIFIGAAVATRPPPQRSSVSDRNLRGVAWHAAADRRDHHPHGGARRGVLPDLVRLRQLSPGIWQLSSPLGHADCLALRSPSLCRRADRAVHDRAAGQRHPHRIRPSRAVGRRSSNPAHRRRRPTERAAVSAPAILALMSFCFLFFGYLGVPVPFSLMAGVFVRAALTDVSLAAIVQKIFDGMDSEALLAIPFFLLVGELMSSANVVVRIANLSLSLVGHIRGGLSQVVVVFSMFFSEMSGSTTADVAVMSRALGTPMRREGYSPAFIAAIIASASTIAALVPPSITAVVYGAVGNVSIAGLFMAGVVPGMMIGFGLMIYCYFFCPVRM